MASNVVRRDFLSMTSKAAQGITGVDVDVFRDNRGKWIAEANIEDGVVHVEGSSHQDALHRLVDEVYRRRCRIVLRRAGWACQECGRSGVGLQVHHRVLRSHGRDDRLTNLEALDRECHQRKHG